jgi:CDP-paratose synthetase
MHILLTGATGFLGRHLLPGLTVDGHRVTVLKRSTSDTSVLDLEGDRLQTWNADEHGIKPLFESTPVDVIVHLATDYTRVLEQGVSASLQANIDMPTQLLHAAAQYGCRGFVNADTCIETRYALYAATKKAFLEIARYYAANHDIRFVNMRLAYFYGPGDYSHRFLPLLIERVLSEEALAATGGEQRRDLIHVEDVAAAFRAVLSLWEGWTEPWIDFDIGSGQTVSLRELATRVATLAEKELRIQWGELPYARHELFDMALNTQEACSRLNWRPRVSLDEGLRRTIAWFRTVER